MALGNEYEKIFLKGKARPARKANNLTAICESIVYGVLDVSQPKGSPTHPPHFTPQKHY
jgi:hypothetical protein